MPLPDLIEILPLHGPLRASVTVPGSKSITNRALVLAALGTGTTTLRGALWSEDTQVMTDCLRRLGFTVEIEPDPDEEANRTLRIEGQGGRIPNAGRDGAPLELFVGNAGTAARFLSALVCLGQGTYRLSGVPRMHERPQAELFRALRTLGYKLESDTDRLPVVIHGEGPRTGRCVVSAHESSQFASALILASQQGGWDIEVEAADEDELPYVEMTRHLMNAMPRGGGTFQVEPDASSGSYFWAVGELFPAEPGDSASALERSVRVEHWPTSGWQIDQAFPELIRLSAPRPIVSRREDLGDSIMTAIVLAPFGAEPVRFTDLGRLRVQECERVRALRVELQRCGATVIEEGDTLIVHPSQLHGADIETYDDHRMAMCFAVVGLKVPGIRLRHPSCVRKTFPNFFARLAAAPPAGLGMRCLDGRTRRELNPEDLRTE